MKKPLPRHKEVFLYRRHGRVLPWGFFAEDIVEAANSGLTSEKKDHLVIQQLRDWMNRYLEEGVTDDFLDGLNAAIHKIHYTKVLLPLDLLPSGTEYPQNGYIAQYDEMPSPEAYAADDFSKLLVSGELKRLKRCQMEECEKFFLGPPQAKWCSTTCGSKYRVRAKRKRESS
jgi:predicted RNA-binding Zn ribbon-like protein